MEEKEAIEKYGRDLVEAAYLCIPEVDFDGLDMAVYGIYDSIEEFSFVFLTDRPNPLPEDEIKKMNLLSYGEEILKDFSHIEINSKLYVFF